MKTEKHQPQNPNSFNLNSNKLGLKQPVRCLGFLATLAFALAIAPPASATITVTTLDDSGPGSLRQAIADAAPGDTIDFAVTGTITLTNGELVVAKNLIISGPGRTNLNVSGNDASRVFNINSASAVVAMSDFAIINGNPGVDNGGGIRNLGNLTVSNCIVSHCTAVMAGAGILSDNASTLRVVNSIVSNNSCWSGGAWGAGIACPWYNIQLTVINSTISSNYNPTAGGAIMLGNGGVGAITNSTFSGNVTGGTGGGIYLQYAASLFLDGCTISGNTAGEYGGGGIANYEGATAIDIRNSVVAGNDANTGPDCSGPIASLDYNLIQNTNGATITGVTTHNIYGQDPLLGPLADNGGPTPTHALLPGSPALDQGSSGGLATDQRGLPRPFNFPAYYDAADASDIGAVEMQERAQTGPVFTVNSNDDADDGVAGIAHCSLREAIAAANANSDSNSIVFAATVPGLMNGVTGTIVLTNGQLVIGTMDAYYYGGYEVSIRGPGAANLTLSGNNASRIISKQFSTVSISDLTIADGNTSSTGGIGGGIENAGGTLSVSDCVISNCVASQGGGISSLSVYSSGASLGLSRCTITRNAAGSGGGGVWSYEYTWASDSTICSNAGGGVYVSGFIGGFWNCTISGNDGPGLYRGTAGAPGYEFNLASCTICSNSGVGIAFANWTSWPITVRSTILSGNSGGAGPECSGGLNSGDFNLIQNTNGFVITGTNTHDIYNQDPLLGPLADNGGPTLTHALLPASPAIDQGSGGGLVTDQRGQARPIDFPDLANAEGGDGSDIGACEVRDLAQTGPVITVNSTDDVDDGVPGVLHCSLREAIAHAAPGGTIDFAVTGTITLTSGELVITNDLTITGPGAANLTVSGNNASRVFRLSGTGNVTISGLTITQGNSTGGGSNDGGGGIFSWGPNLLVRDCTVTGNYSAMSGGGIFCIGGAMTLLESTVSSNSAQYGGGIRTWYATANLTGCAVVNNSARYKSAGGIESNSYLGLTNCTVSGNGGWFGGGLWIQGAGTIVSTTICSNSAVYGGGIYFYNVGQKSIMSSIVADNYPSDLSGDGLVSFDYNLIGRTNGATITGVTTHNIYGKDPLLGPLGDNGGPTPTHALLPGSPAIDHGSSGGLATDQRGLPRPFNFPAYYDADDASDIGAVEMQEGPQPGPVFTVNTTDDVEDGVPGIAHCSLREAIAAANANADTNTIDFAAEVPGVMTGVTGTITLTNGQLAIGKALALIGPGAKNLRISGNNTGRVFTIGSSCAMSGLTIADGRASNYSYPDANIGGGIYLGNCELLLTDCIVTNCACLDSTGFGIFNLQSHLMMSGCALVGNGDQWGGVLWNDRGSVDATNCTFSGNIGVGVWNYNGSVLLESCTICSNSIGIWQRLGPFTVHNTVIAGSGGADCYGDFAAPIASGDYNLIGSTGGYPITGNTAHDIYGEDPKLGPLADLGGPTPTHALRFDSPAIDAGHSGGLTTDQRGLPRPIDSPDIANAEGGDGSDIGAYEADPNLRILAIEKSGQDIRLRFNNLFGRTYKVERTDSLVPPVIWTPVLGAEVVAGNGGTVTIIDPAGAAAPQHFYRIQLDTESGTGGSTSALSFDGGDRVVVANQPALNPSTITVETWVSFGRLPYGGGYTPTEGQMLVVKGGDTTPGVYYLSQGGSSPTEHIIGFTIGATGNDGKGVNVTWPLHTNRWYHIAGTYDGSSMQLFIDGQVAASNYVGAVTIGNSSPLYLGFNDAFSFFLTGGMDDVRIWNYARTEAQIRATMYSTLSGNEPGLAGCWDFNESADSQTVLDRTPNGCHGRLGSSMGVDGDDPTRVVRGPVR